MSKSTPMEAPMDNSYAHKTTFHCLSLTALTQLPLMILALKGKMATLFQK